jgi:hypothetical protein
VYSSAPRSSKVTTSGSEELTSEGFIVDISTGPIGTKSSY